MATTLRNLILSTSLLGASFVPSFAMAESDVTIMEGFPPTEQSQVTFGNYRTAPYMEWSFRNAGAPLNTVMIPREGQIAPLTEKYNESIGDLPVTDFNGNKTTVMNVLENHHADSYLVLQGDEILFEKYFNGNTKQYQHIWFSATKSLTSTAFGILAAEHGIKLDESPVDYIPELKGSGFERVSFQNVLNHATAIDFEENYTDPEADFLKYYGPAMNMAKVPGGRDATPEDTEIYGIYDFLTKFIGENEELEPGHRFDYNSSNTDLLGWLISRISGMPYNEFVQQNIWSKLGTENDAYVAVDRAFLPVATGGINTTLRDAARFGSMILNEGKYNGQQIVPSEWVNASIDLNDSDYARMTNQPRYEGSEWVAYKNMWWVLDAEKGEYAAVGIHGQVIYINRSTETVIAYFSSQPDASAVNSVNFWSKMNATRAIAKSL
ncbi:serine hydrolase [uncultured Vibrio sp.]|uniref:serine hydrolase domain-containing protein n=1 Tax=uncultured Vibrio sp. TaxID=114054 RepID=UPI0025CF5A7C|nr:serine hydrolase [uncultured Vibrio sp.]